MQQINFTGNLKRVKGGAMLFIIEETEETVSGFSKETVKALWSYFVLIQWLDIHGRFKLV